MRHSAAFLVTLVVLAFVGCGRSPASPDSQNPGAPIHDTLNATGSTTALDGVSSELSGAYDRQWYDDFVKGTDRQWILLVEPPPHGFMGYGLYARSVKLGAIVNT